MPQRTFDLDDTLAILERTPAILEVWFAGLPETWTGATEGEDEWSPHDVLAHLIHGERTNWMVRARHILSGERRPFASFDQIAPFNEGEEPGVEALLARFAALRQENILALRGMALTSDDLERTAQHPTLGEVTLAQLLATWAVHDLNHLGQIAATMARAYTDAVGPWRTFLGILGPGGAASQTGTRLITVDSSMLYAAGYDEDQRALEVVFWSGGIYRYRNVPRALYEQLLSADSVGQFMHAHIFGLFEEQKLRSRHH